MLWVTFYCPFPSIMKDTNDILEQQFFVFHHQRENCYKTRKQLEKLQYLGQIKRLQSYLKKDDFKAEVLGIY